ncbi:hypothetical protein ACFXK0_16870 [Nocardia sp. NPDC059177]|uniref:hypothetical protein n=1 Tax=Nocardia sp. NPDC059177 TaxID=3346759 RepID=UPI0036928A65
MSPGLTAWYYGVPVVLVTGIWWAVLCGDLDGARPGGRSLVAVQPLMVVCSVAAVMMHLPERMAWVVSESTMTAAAQRCDATANPHWVGVFRVAATTRNHQGACEFRIGERVGDDGLAYFPPGVEPTIAGADSTGDTSYTPFDGRWCRFDGGARYID